MYDYTEYDDDDQRSRLPSQVKAALLGAIGILIVHGITYLTGGLGVIASLLLFTIIYAAVGFMAVMFLILTDSVDRGKMRQN